MFQINLDWCITEIASTLQESGTGDGSIKELIDAIFDPESFDYLDIQPDVYDYLLKNSFSKEEIKKAIKNHKSEYFEIEDGIYYSYITSPWEKTSILRDAISKQKKLKVCSEKELLSLCDWDSDLVVPSKYTAILEDGYQHACSSKNELTVVQYLFWSGFAKKIRGQHFYIEYKSRKRIKKYYPDIVFLTRDNNICFVEVKPLYDVVDRTNIIKINRMKEYCNKHGYACLVLNNNLETFEWSMSLFKEFDDGTDFMIVVRNFVKELLDKGKHNCKEEIYQFIKKYNKYRTETYIKECIAYLVYAHNLYFKGNFSGSSEILLTRKQGSTI